MKKVSVLLALCVGAVGLAFAMLATADDGKGDLRSGGDGPLTMAVYGDAPYGTSPTDTAEFDATPAFIDAVNKDRKVKLVLHVGDIHSGKQYCPYAYDVSIYNLWTQFRDPLVYTPGDNEWADCTKTAEGGDVRSPAGTGPYVDYANGDPVANLGLVRQIFFSQPGRTLGGGDKKVVSQAQAYDPAHPDDAQYVENVMWEQSGVLFVSINLPGGSNNDADVWYCLNTPAPSWCTNPPVASGEQAQEVDLRTHADLRWLDAAFAQARTDNDAGVVILTQADMWDLEKGAGHLTGYQPFVSDIASNTLSFGKPVLLFNGDSHVFRSDNPLVVGAPCVTEGPTPSGTTVIPCATDVSSAQPGPGGTAYNVPNFHRIVVHGSTMPLEYLRVSIDTKKQPAASSSSFGPFSWERVQPS
jgi:hypothetical protein